MLPGLGGGVRGGSAIHFNPGEGLAFLVPAQLLCRTSSQLQLLDVLGEKKGNIRLSLAAANAFEKVLRIRTARFVQCSIPTVPRKRSKESGPAMPY